MSKKVAIDAVPMRLLSAKMHRTSDADGRISSSSSASLDSCVLGQDTVDAVPRRMPLICAGEDYIKHSQASVDNLISSGRSYGSLPRAKRPYDAGSVNDGDTCQYFELHNMPDAGSSRNCNDTERSRTLPAGRYTYYNNTNGNSIATDNNNRGDGTGCRQKVLDYTETDLGPRRQPKPNKDDIRKDERRSTEESEISESLTPGSSSSAAEQVQGCCCITRKICLSMCKWKYLFERFSAWDVITLFCSVVIYIFDVITDIAVAIWYHSYRDQDTDFILFFRLTLAFVIGPSLVVQLFSYRWVIDDFRIKKQREKSNSQNSDEDCPSITFRDLITLISLFILHFFQLATLYRYMRALVFGFRSQYYAVKKKKEHQKHFDKLWKCENHDINFLRLLESFLESAPQLVLQIYVMLTKGVETINLISCSFSLLGLSTVMVSIQRAIRNTNPKKKQLSFLASIVMFIWRGFTISSRVLACSLFLTIQPLAFLIFALLHWFCAAIWIAWKGTNFCNRKAAEYFFDVVIGIIYTFCFFNVHEARKPGEISRARWRMLVFYIIILVENSTLSIVWFFFRDTVDVIPTSSYSNSTVSWINESTTEIDSIYGQDIVFPDDVALALVVLVHILFFLGMCFMLFYYACLHPQRDHSVCECTGRKGSITGSNRDEPSDIVNGNCRSEENSVQQGVLQNPDPDAKLTQQAPTGKNIEKRQNLRVTRSNAETKIVGASTGETAPNMSITSWTDMFDRESRANKVYTRLYSKEKLLDGNDRAGSSTPIARESKQNANVRKSVEPREERTVHSRDGLPAPISGSIRKKPVSRSQLSLPNPTTHCSGGNDHLLPTATSRNAPREKMSYTAKTLNPQDLRSHRHAGRSPSGQHYRGYSASMSCLVDGKSGSQTASNTTGCYSLKADEVIESMETNV